MQPTNGTSFGSDLAARSKRRALQAALHLPGPARRALVGEPVHNGDSELDPQTQALLKLVSLAPGKGLDHTASIAEIRHSLDEGMRITSGHWRVGEVQELAVGDLHARLYVPSTVDPEPGPGMVFFHGGGFIAGNVDSYDAVCRFLAEHSGTRFVSIDYRLAPENPFPAAYADALDAFGWVRDHAAELCLDPDRIGVAGDSAGGNLAAGVAIAFGRRCALQVLLYPGTTAAAEFPSRELFGDGFLLTAEFIDLAVRAYAGPMSPEQYVDPAASPLHAELDDTVAPALVVTAGFDPLRDEGEAYADKLASVGVPVDKRRAGDQIHGFIGLIGVSDAARRATHDIALAINAHLDIGAARGEAGNSPTTTK